MNPLELIVEESEHLGFKKPEYSDWKCELLFWTWTPEVGKVPCCFYRIMQSLLLGAKWSKK